MNRKEDAAEGDDKKSRGLFDQDSTFSLKQEVMKVPTEQEIEEAEKAMCEFEHCDAVEPLADGFEAERYMGQWY